ncbi:MAG: diphthine--ammonia ligase [Candidatus Pacearchaeota archaeon]|jgi:ABC transporter with metal-binding/Fe-S-binding domain ATP-binding protein|nr:TIGR00289 family protein [Candidatus Pacearchaeota archaeon]MDP7521022.1 diphthine--ammonia ligase [Candidatus Pacearchaeota archaeon]|tara:strand:+ start:931 stop:1599 length:669 start_codon:yes stop_codon:yes gene_type:complete
MKVAVLFSGGKDSTYAIYLAKKYGYKIACLISIISKNEDSFMFHTPTISKTKKQAKTMNIPIVIQNTSGKKEEELEDLERVIKKVKDEFKIKGIITGAIQSIYQASRIQKICDKLNLECFNPLWQKDELEYWNELLDNKFEIIITKVACEGLYQGWLGKKINKNNLKNLIDLSKKFKFHLGFEGGEAESFVLNCPLFKKQLKIVDSKISGEKNSWKMEVEVE